MADVYLRPDAGDGFAHVRLRPDVADVAGPSSDAGPVTGARLDYVVVRRFQRTDFPQFVYASVLNLFDPPFGVPSRDAGRNDWRSPDRRSDRTFLQQTVPDFAWVSRAVDATVSTWAPIWGEETGAFRSPAGPKLDVRPYEWLEPAWIVTSIPVVVTDAQRWPAILSALGLNYRSGSGPRLDVRQVEQPPFSWPRPVVDAIVASWLGVFDAELGYRSDARPPLHVSRYEWAPEFGWVQPVVDAVVSNWRPVFEAQISGRTPERRLSQFKAVPWQPIGDAWLFAPLHPPITVAQAWPAILEALGLSYRSVARGRLDVRQYEWPTDYGWQQPSLFFAPTGSSPARPANTDALLGLVLNANTDALFAVVLEANTDAVRLVAFPANTDAT